ncbi:MAG TPA: HupE/UreJ family protein [Thiotrichales bacterium]|nr:HupE/UreJ family protein [Thiotrichales bacterium]
MLTIFSAPVVAHKLSDSYLFLQENTDGLTLRWDIALRDLEKAIGLDGNRDQKITWSEVKQKQKEIVAYALSRMQVKRGGSDCLLKPESIQFERHSDGGYVVLRNSLVCEVNGPALYLNYRLLFEIDPTHRGVLLDQRKGKNRGPYVLSPDENSLDLGDQSSGRPRMFYNSIREGIWHIWVGYDHILFIITLLLPAVFYFSKRRWQAVNKLKPALLDLFKVVTAFTLAHSITLSLAVLEIISLPVRFIETAIAVSIIIVALNNLKPIFTRARWSLAFMFGLLHGFGFANVLIDLSLPTQSLATALLGFNLGVELGQLAIIIALFPLAFLVRRTGFYQLVIFKGGSIVAAAVAVFWVVERLA